MYDFELAAKRRLTDSAILAQQDVSCSTGPRVSSRLVCLGQAVSNGHRLGSAATLCHMCAHGNKKIFFSCPACLHSPCSSADLL